MKNSFWDKCKKIWTVIFSLRKIENLIFNFLCSVFYGESGDMVSSNYETSNVRRFDSLGPRLYTAEVFSVYTGSDRTNLSILSLNWDVNFSSWIVKVQEIVLWFCNIVNRKGLSSCFECPRIWIFLEWVETSSREWRPGECHSRLADTWCLNLIG